MYKRTDNAGSITWDAAGSFTQAYTGVAVSMYDTKIVAGEFFLLFFFFIN